MASLYTKIGKSWGAKAPLAPGIRRPWNAISRDSLPSYVTHCYESSILAHLCTSKELNLQCPWLELRTVCL